MERTNIYISADWDSDGTAARRLYEWNEGHSRRLPLTDGCDLQEEAGIEWSCTIKKALSDRMDTAHTFVLIVGGGTKAIRSGDCRYCNNNNSFTYSCGHGNSVNYHSFIEYECEKAVQDGLKIVVLYLDPEADREKCPDAVKNVGTHIAMRRDDDGALRWDFQAVRQALSYESDDVSEMAGDERGRDSDIAWEEVSTEHIVQDEWIDFRKSVYRFPDGKEIGPFYTYSRRDYVVIVSSDTEGNYLCVRQFRQGIREVTTEFPAGGIERKDGREYGSNDLAVENALAAAKRELLEETGYESDEWCHLLTVPSNATISDNYAHLFAAKNCRKVSGQSLDEMEFINVKTLKAQEIEDLIAEGGFKQAMHITAWLLANRRQR